MTVSILISNAGQKAGCGVGEEFRADPEGLRAKVPAFRQLGTEVEALVQRLHQLVSSDAAPWGTDDSGKAFGESFAPEEQRTLTELDSLTEVLRQTGPDLRQVAANFEQQDLLGRQMLRSAEPVLRTGPDQAVNPVLVAGPGSGNPTVTGVPERSDASASTASADAALPGTAGPAPAASSPEPGGANPASPGAPGAPSGGYDPASTAGQRPSDPPRRQREPGDSEGQRLGPRDVPAAQSGPAARSAPAAPTTAGAGPPPPAASRGVAAAASEATRPAHPRPASAPGSPWSKAASGAPPRISGPGPGPTDTPPRMPGRPAQRPAEKPAEPERRSGEGTGEPIAVRLARELAERHGVRAFGFDTPGVPREVLTEMVAAVGDVLPRHPAIGLSALGIGELPGSMVIRLDLGTSDAEPGDIPETALVGAAKITLSVRSAVEPAVLERAIRSDEDAGALALGCAQRPVYSSVVRELGRALDAAGGFRARTATRHALVAAYLPLADRDTTGSLSRTVSGFGEWRAQLRGGLRDGRFDPEAALAEAFTEVVLDVARASAQARTLHRLLVETARSLQVPPGGAAT